MTTAEITATINSYANLLNQFEQTPANLKAIWHMGMSVYKFWDTVSGAERKETWDSFKAITARFHTACYNCLG